MEEQSEFEQFMRNLEVRQPGFSLKMALYLWDKRSTEDLDPNRPRFDENPAGYFWADENIQKMVRSGQKIAVVKEIRSQHYMGLKEAKDLMDLIFDGYRQGTLR